jgi:RNA-directed DNA polymerase
MMFPPVRLNQWVVLNSLPFGPAYNAALETIIGMRTPAFGSLVLAGKPSKKNTHAFLEKVRTIIQQNRTATQERLIRQLNPVIRGWANYHQSIVAADTFSKVDHVLWQSLWRWAKRRHPHKPSQWVMRKYWHTIGQRSWMFAADTGDRTPTGQIVWLKLHHTAATKIRRHPQIKSTANPFDLRWRRYFEDRAFLKRFGIHREETGINPS